MDASSSSNQDAAAAAPMPPKMPKPHRCNARVEDVLQSVFSLEFSAKIQPAWRNFRACMKSEPGQEPTDAYVVITDPSLYLDPHKMYKPRRSS